MLLVTPAAAVTVTAPPGSRSSHGGGTCQAVVLGANCDTIVIMWDPYHMKCDNAVPVKCDNAVPMKCDNVGSI